MVLQGSLLVTLAQLVDRLPMPQPPTKRGRGHPKFYSDRLFLKALVIMIVRHLHTVHELLSVLAQPTAEMMVLRQLLTEQESFPSRRTWERRLKAIPDTLPAQIGCLGRYLIDLIQPWLSIAPSCTPEAASGIKSIGSKENFPIPRLILKPTGLNQAGMAGSTAGNSTWFPSWRLSGFLLPLY